MKFAICLIIILLNNVNIHLNKDRSPKQKAQVNVSLIKSISQ
jgi:hypothetical protein